MPAPVIDLISSSPPPVAKPVSASGAVTKDVPSSRSGDAPIVHPIDQQDGGPSTVLDFGEQITSSLAAGLIDLTDDFEAQESAAARQNQPQIPPDDDVGVRPHTTGHNSPFRSDDFGSIEDMNGPILVQSTGNKRRRLSPRSRHNLRKSTSRSPRSSPKPSTQDSLPSPSRMITGPAPPSVSVQSPLKSACAVSSPDPFKTSPIRVLEPGSKSRPGVSFGDSPDPFESPPLPRQRQPIAKAGGARRPVNIEISSSAGDHGTPAPRNQIQEWDPISSSAPEITPSRRNLAAKGKGKVIELGSDTQDESGDELPDIGDIQASSAQYLSKPFRSSLTRSRSDVNPPRPQTTRAQPSGSREEKAKQREVRSVEKAAEKEQKRRDRELQRQIKVRQKERAAALAEANKVRTDKKVSTPEMIVDLPLSLSDTIKLQTGTLLQSLNVEHHIWEAPVENAIKWRRKVTSRFDSELGFWEPILPRIEDEHHVAVLMTAEKFVELAMGNGVSEHVATVSQHFPHHHVIYLLEGVAAWIRRNRNVRNRRFASGVRSQEAPAASTSRARQTTAEYISEDVVEDALLELQVMHNVFIHHTAVPLETAQWITVLTQHISTIPYRKQKDQATLGAGFCMETGQVKTGDDAKDTYVRLLQEIVRVTAPIAYGVAAEFGTVSALVRGLEEGGPSTLENIRKSANKDGAFSDRTVGQAVSKRMYKVFTGQDEGSTDV